MITQDEWIRVAAGNFDSLRESVKVEEQLRSCLSNIEGLTIPTKERVMAADAVKGAIFFLKQDRRNFGIEE